MIITITLSIILSAVALILTAIFFTYRPTMLVRKGLLATQIGALSFMTIGCFLYVTIGGSLKPTMLIEGLIGHAMLYNEINFSFGGGSGVALFSTVWLWTLPLWSLWALKIKYCDDYFSEEDEMNEETAELITEIRHEAEKMDPETARSIIFPVKATDIINWYSSNKNGAI